MTTYLTRSVRFSAAHRYYRPEWTEEENRRRFGACANPHGHGHEYTLEVMVAGKPDHLTGFCVDLERLDETIRDRVTARLDHQHINHAIDAFGEGRLTPTTENLAIWIWQELEQGLRGIKLMRVRLRENDSLCVDFYGGSQKAPDLMDGTITV